MIWEDQNTSETGDGINRRMFQKDHVGSSGSWNTRRRDEKQGEISGGQNIFQLRSELGCSCCGVSGSGRRDKTAVKVDITLGHGEDLRGGGGVQCLSQREDMSKPPETISIWPTEQSMIIQKLDSKSLNWLRFLPFANKPCSGCRAVFNFKFFSRLPWLFLFTGVYHVLSCKQSHGHTVMSPMY